MESSNTPLTARERLSLIKGEVVNGRQRWRGPVGMFVSKEYVTGLLQQINDEFSASQSADNANTLQRIVAASETNRAANLVVLANLDREPQIPYVDRVYKDSPLVPRRGLRQGLLNKIRHLREVSHGRQLLRWSAAAALAITTTALVIRDTTQSEQPTDLDMTQISQPTVASLTSPEIPLQHPSAAANATQAIVQIAELAPPQSGQSLKP